MHQLSTCWGNHRQYAGPVNFRPTHKRSRSLLYRILKRRPIPSLALDRVAEGEPLLMWETIGKYHRDRKHTKKGVLILIPREQTGSRKGIVRSRVKQYAGKYNSAREVFTRLITGPIIMYCGSAGSLNYEKFWGLDQHYYFVFPAWPTVSRNMRRCES